MPSPTWTTADQADFLFERVPEYAEIKKGPQNTARNNALDALYNRTVEEFTTKFRDPASASNESPWDKMDWDKVNMVGKDFMVAAKDRINQWFWNHGKPDAAGSGSLDVLDLLDTKKAPKRRITNVFYDLNKERLKPKLDEEYKAYCKTVPADAKPKNIGAFANSFKSRAWNEATEAEKEKAEKKKADLENPKACGAGEVGENLTFEQAEDARISAAREHQDLTEGVRNKDGKQFHEAYPTEYQSTVKAWASFVNEAFPLEKRQQMSLGRRVNPSVSGSAVSANNNLQGHENSASTTGNSTSVQDSGSDSQSRTETDVGGGMDCGDDARVDLEPETVAVHSKTSSSDAPGTNVQSEVEQYGDEPLSYNSALSSTADASNATTWTPSTAVDWNYWTSLFGSSTNTSTQFDNLYQGNGAFPTSSPFPLNDFSPMPTGIGAVNGYGYQYPSMPLVTNWQYDTQAPLNEGTPSIPATISSVNSYMPSPVPKHAEAPLVPMPLAPLTRPVNPAFHSSHPTAASPLPKAVIRQLPLPAANETNKENERPTPTSPSVSPPKPILGFQPPSVTTPNTLISKWKKQCSKHLREVYPAHKVAEENVRMVDLYLKLEGFFDDLPNSKALPVDSQPLGMVTFSSSGFMYDIVPVKLTTTLLSSDDSDWTVSFQCYLDHLIGLRGEAK